MGPAAPKPIKRKRVMSYRLVAVLSSIFLMTTVTAFPAQLKESWTWPEKPKNLQVLPKDWSGSRLQPVMLGFTRALGVRCQYCHVGEEGKPLNTFDFASDENPNKNRAREMYRMLEDIDNHLKNIQPSGDQRVNMGCNTCHRGRPRPMTLEEELGEKYRKSGVEAALDYYADLKQKYYGRGPYDFGENALNNFGYEVMKKDPTGAVQVLRLNAEEFPQSGNVWDSLAEAYMKSGDLKEAEEYYLKALERDASDQNAKDMLAKLKEPKKK